MVTPLVQTVGFIIAAALLRVWDFGTCGAEGANVISPQ